MGFVCFECKQDVGCCYRKVERQSPVWLCSQSQRMGGLILLCCITWVMAVAPNQGTASCSFPCSPLLPQWDSQEWGLPAGRTSNHRIAKLIELEGAFKSHLISSNTLQRTGREHLEPLALEGAAWLLGFAPGGWAMQREGLMCVQLVAINASAQAEAQ